MKNVTSVEFCFENVEAMDFDAKYFGIFSIEGIHRSVHRIACNSISQFVGADRVVLELYSEANDTYYPFGDEEEATTKFDRILAYDDITSITLKYEDGSEESFYVEYDEGDLEDVLGAPNINQHTMLSSLGNLYILIGNGIALYDIFDIEEINDAETMHFHKHAQGVFQNDKEQ